MVAFKRYITIISDVLGVNGMTSEPDLELLVEGELTAQVKALLNALILEKPNLSFELLNKSIGNYWYDPNQKVGVIPLNIPYFQEPRQKFALLFVGNNKSQIEEMYNAASVLESTI